MAHEENINAFVTLKKNPIRNFDFDISVKIRNTRLLENPIRDLFDYFVRSGLLTVELSQDVFFTNSLKLFCFN